MVSRCLVFVLLVSATTPLAYSQSGGANQLKQLLKRYPAADANKDGKLTWTEAKAYRDQQRGKTNKNKKNIAPPPTHENVKYGQWDRNLFDIWLPESDQPTPLIVYIHGGGFVGGSKNGVRTQTNVQQALDQNVAIASIQYRFRYPDDGDTSDPQRTGLPNILRDSARAIQFIRHHAGEYNIDPTRVACYGGSAGAGTSIWLAFHDDLADADNDDPVLRQSTRISAAGMLNGQFTYDLLQWDNAFSDRQGDLVKTHGRNGVLEGHKFLGMTEEEFTGQKGADARADVDMMAMISPDDPPVFVLTTNADVPVTTRGIYNHHPRHGSLIEQRCRQKGVEVLCLLPKVRSEDAGKLKDDPDIMLDFFFKHLGVQR